VNDDAAVAGAGLPPVNSARASSTGRARARRRKRAGIWTPLGDLVETD
jgi:hypothetical protein